MFFGYIYFVLYLPRVEGELGSSKVFACFLRGDKSLKGKKGTHSRAAANKKLILAKDAVRRTSGIAKAPSLREG
jgi:hypothetical protein